MVEKTRKAGRLKVARPCRYCGHVAADHVREETAQRTMPLYSCRDVAACGSRLRDGKPAPVLSEKDLPF
jgi:hypothetical protein